MASTEVMSVRIAVALLLNEIINFIGKRRKRKRYLYEQGSGFGKGISSVHLV
jgi:hypothetical protein